MQAATTEVNPNILQNLISNLLAMVHAEESDPTLGPPEHAFGWNFFLTSISRSATRKLAQLPGSEIMKVKGDSFDQKFVNWLNGKASEKVVGETIHFILLSDLRSSRYGFF